jgi:preprotein translocase subunit SecE
MGFNPFREHKRDTADMVLVVIAVVVVLGLVAWGFFGG